MKLSENRFFKPTRIHLKLKSGNPSIPENSDNSDISAGGNSTKNDITESILARIETGSYDEVRTDSDANNWSPLSFMQWFAKENKDNKLPGADNMDVMKYENDNNDDNYDKLYSEKTDPASKLTGKKPERGSVPKRS